MNLLNPQKNALKPDKLFSLRTPARSEKSYKIKPLLPLTILSYNINQNTELIKHLSF